MLLNLGRKQKNAKEYNFWGTAKGYLLSDLENNEISLWFTLRSNEKSNNKRNREENHTVADNGISCPVVIRWSVFKHCPGILPTVTQTVSSSILVRRDSAASADHFLAIPVVINFPSPRLQKFEVNESTSTSACLLEVKSAPLQLLRNIPISLSMARKAGAMNEKSSYTQAAR